MIEWILNFEFTSLMGVLLYWVPASLCAYGYTVRTWVNYQKDVKQREETAQILAKDKTRIVAYYPTDTIGTLVGRAFVTALPVANIWAGAFDVAPGLFSSFFEWVGKVFDTPLVPAKEIKRRD